jgi:serine/threonine-protein kinase
MPQWIGTTIGKVRIEKQLAKGGMAEVYLGTHLTLDRPVAVKVMHSYVEEVDEMQVRFQREAKVVAALRHPNIVQIFDFDTLDGHPYIVMEYIRGPSLAAYLRNLHENNERMQPQHVARLLSKLASALDYAHEQGVIHRDIKPGNILLHTKTGESRRMFTDQLEPILTDFGLVRIMHATTQTASGLVSGTPAYISPEQAQGNKLDHRTDIYSLGVVLYEILAGRVPFDAETSWTIIYKHIHEEPPAIPNMQPEIQEVIQRALAKDRVDRYQSCRELAIDYMNAIGMIAEAPTLDFDPPSPRRSTTQTQPQPDPVPDRETGAAAAPRRRTMVPWILASVVLFVLAALMLPQLFDASHGNAPLTPEYYSMPGMGTSESNILPAGGTAPLGVLRFQDGTAPADQVTLSTDGMPQPAAGSQYEAWLIEDDAEQRVSVGFIQFDNDGKGSLTYVDPQGRNLIGMYHGVEITVEPNPDDSPNPSNVIAYSATLPDEGFMHVRHLLYSFDATPGQIGFIDGLNTDTILLQQLAQEMLTAYQAGDEAKVRSLAEGMINVIVGKQGPDYQDWNQNGTVDDPGDGFGLLLNGDNEGYIEGTKTHANLSRTSADATQNMQIHGEHVQISADNVGKWIPPLRDQLMLITKSPFDASMEGMIRNSVALANQIQNGVDVNGNEIIEPIPGEGGTQTAYEHAYYMADILITAEQ